MRGFSPVPPMTPMTPMSRTLYNENQSDNDGSCISPIRTAAHKNNTSQKLETLGCLTDSHRSKLEQEELELASSANSGSLPSKHV